MGVSDQWCIGVLNFQTHPSYDLPVRCAKHRLGGTSVHYGQRLSHHGSFDQCECGTEYKLVVKSQGQRFSRVVPVYVYRVVTEAQSCLRQWCELNTQWAATSPSILRCFTLLLMRVFSELTTASHVICHLDHYSMMLI